MPLLKLKVNGREESVPLNQDVTILGRATENAVYVDDRQASRNHCQVERFAGGWKLVDLASRNGTKVNGVTVNSHLLKSGDRIEIGDTVIQFLDAPDETDPRIPGVPRAAQGVAPAAPAWGGGAPPHPPPAGGAPPGWPPQQAAVPYPAPPHPGEAPPGYPAGQPQGYPPAGYPPPGYPPPGYPPPGYPPQGYPQGAPPAGYPPAAPPPEAPPAAPAQRSGVRGPGASPHGAHRPPAPAPSGGNPGVIVGAVIVVLALLAGGALLMNNSKGDPSKGSAWRQTLERGEELYRKADYPAAAEELRKIPSGAKEYRNAQTILADIAQKKKADDEAREIVAAQAAWGPIRDRFRRYEDNELPTADEEELREQLRSFIRNHPKAFELARAREYYQKMGGKPEDVGGTGTGEDKLAKEAEARWAVLQQRVAMNERGELPQEEQDRLTAELRNFITLYYRFPEAAEAQRVLRGLGREVPPVNGTETPPPGGDPKNFAELVRLVDGLVANNSWGEAVALLDAWVKKDVTGPDAGPADDKIREVRKGADNWYLGQEAEADSLAQAGKFAEAKAILLDAVGRLGEKWFFENTAAARKKITGLEKAMGGGK